MLFISNPFVKAKSGLFNMAARMQIRSGLFKEIVKYLLLVIRSGPV